MEHLNGNFTFFLFSKYIMRNIKICDKIWCHIKIWQFQNWTKLTSVFLNCNNWFECRFLPFGYKFLILTCKWGLIQGLSVLTGDETWESVDAGNETSAVTGHGVARVGQELGGHRVCGHLLWALESHNSYKYTVKYQYNDLQVGLQLNKKKCLENVLFRSRPLLDSCIIEKEQFYPGLWLEPRPLVLRARALTTELSRTITNPW